MVTFDPPQQIDATTWLLTWSSDQPAPVTFAIYVDGALVAQTQAASWQFKTPLGLIEVFDTGSPIPTGYPSKAVIVWYAAAGVAEYLVQEYVGSSWLTRASILDGGGEGGRGYFIWTSGVLADSQSHSFQVVPAGINGNDGAVASLNLLMVRNPDSPAAAFAYDPAGKTVTISAS